MNDQAQQVRVCACCGLTQHVPTIPPGWRAQCARCRTGMMRASALRLGNSRAAAIAMAALILYPFGVALPMIEVARFGHTRASSILEGIAKLFGSGEWLVGTIVLLCSVVFPVGKLLALLVLSVGARRLAHHHRALTYRIVDWTGRWGMLDVLLVAVLIAVVKLGDIVQVTIGPAAAAFGLCVVLSLLAAACFDPHSLWETDE